MLLLEGGAHSVAARVIIQRKRREMSSTASQPRRAKIGDLAGSLRMSRVMVSMTGVKPNLTPCSRRALMEPKRLVYQELTSPI